jgi:hypothetical protein
VAPTTAMSLQSPRHAGKRHGDRLVELIRYKTIIGEKLRARHPESQVAEAITTCNILNLDQLMQAGHQHPPRSTV